MKHRLTIFLSIALGLILTGVWLYIVDLGEMLIFIKKIKIWFVIPLGILFLFIYFLRSLRWKVILSPVENISVSESFNLSMTNYFINFLIPVHAGEVVKSLLLKKMKGTPVSKSLLSIYLDKLTDLLPLFLLLVLTPFLTKELNDIIYLASGILLAGLLLFILFLVLIVYKKDDAVNWAEKILFFLPDKIKIRLRNFIHLFAEGIFSISQLSGRLFEIIVLTLLALIVHCFSMWLFFYSFGIDLPVLTVLVGYLLLNATFLLPAPPGFAGTLELSFVFIFAYLYGYDKNLVSAVAASAHVFTAIIFSLLGFISITLIGTKLTTILKMEPDSNTLTEKLEGYD